MVKGARAVNKKVQEKEESQKEIEYMKKHSATLGNHYTKIEFEGAHHKDYRGKTLMSDYAFYGDDRTVHNSREILGAYLMKRDFPEALPGNRVDVLNYYEDENHKGYVLAKDARSRLKLLFDGVNNVEFKSGFLMHDTHNENDAFKLIFEENEESGNMDIKGYYDLKDMVLQLDGVDRGYHFQIHDENTFSFLVDQEDFMNKSQASYLLVKVLDWEKGEIEYYPFEENVREFVDGYAVLGDRKNPGGDFDINKFHEVYKLLEDGDSFEKVETENFSDKREKREFNTYKNGEYYSFKDGNGGLHLNHVIEDDKGLFSYSVDKTEQDEIYFDKDNNWVQYISNKQDEKNDLLIIDNGNIIWKNESDKKYAYVFENGVYTISLDIYENAIAKKFDFVFVDDEKNVKLNITNVLHPYGKYIKDEDFDSKEIYEPYFIDGSFNVKNLDVHLLEKLLVDNTDFFKDADRFMNL